MASISYECHDIVYRVFQPHSRFQQTHHTPPRPMQIELILNVTSLLIPRRRILGHLINFERLSLETLRFDLGLLQSHDQLRLVLAPNFIRYGIDVVSTAYDMIIHEIVECGLRIADSTTGNNCEVLTLCLEMRVVFVENENEEEEVLIGRATAESELEFERSNYGMVAAKESSVEKMLKKVRVKSRGEDCLICMEELEIGIDASQMPCSHAFHCNCIEKWLKVSHYCPVCRFAMPTD
ncbi:E3 ubiquitin-protein ligase MPSR1-like [Gossypium arboreum]|uniref:E3 ubiquitin-protein ligase MPSR1-like n=1 Tax=Gossypium arboreum TaxID=29729 RepID=UPI000818FCB7|nr:E3 ubiquitin-protein ligase MPSR1-like [Gossypium arboreum]